MRKAKEILEDITLTERKYDYKLAAANDDSFDEPEESKFKLGDFVYFVGNSGDPSYHSFGRINSITDDGKFVIDVICKLDGRTDIDNVADENGQVIRQVYQVFPGQEKLDKKIDTAKKRLERLEQLQKEIKGEE